MENRYNLNRLAYFASVVEAGSFTAAADRLGVTKAVVSQQVMALEKEAGASLLVRTTRSVRPTEAGRIFYERCHAILREADEAFDALGETGAAPSGVLRVTAPTDYGAALVAPVAAEFVRLYPACTVDLDLTDERIDVMAADFDVAVRVGWLQDSSAQARRLANFRQYVVCAPSFATQLPRRLTPTDLATLPFVANGALRDAESWAFSRGQETQEIQVRAGLTVNATNGVLAAVRSGNGWSVLPDYLVAPEIEAGRLGRLLEGWSLPGGGIFIVFPAMRFRPTKSVAFAKMLHAAEKVRASPGEVATPKR